MHHGDVSRTVPFVTRDGEPSQLTAQYPLTSRQASSAGPRSNKVVIMFHRTASAQFGLVLVLSGFVAEPASAYKWPGEDAGLGSAIAAKVIGQQCVGLLSASDMREIDAYLAKSASELANKPDARKYSVNGAPFYETLTQRLTETYTKKYSDPAACDADAFEEAQDTLQKVRKAMAAGKPLYPDENDPDRKPDVGEAITAKVTGEKCQGALTVLELAELELYVARAWVWWAKNAIEADARSTIEIYKSAEKTIASGWKPKDCTEAAVGKAKKVASLVGKAEASVVR